MKNILPLMFIILVACNLQACHNKAKNYNKIADTDTTADDTALLDTTAKLTLAVDKDDSQFAIEAANGGMTEVTLGKLAIQKGKSKKVKNFGAMMVKDHGKADAKLLALMKEKNITLPMAPDPEQQKMIEDLSKKSGSNFDRAYISSMIDDHKQDVKLFSDESKKIQDPDLKAFAIKTLPVLKKHLDAINAIHDSMGN